MEILIKKEDNLVVMVGDNIKPANDEGSEIYYSVDTQKPWKVQKIYINNVEDYEVVDVTGLELPQDVLDFKYVYNSELKSFIISQQWIDNQISD